MPYTSTMSVWVKDLGIRFRIKRDVRPYAGRVLNAIRLEGQNVIGWIEGATANRTYRRDELEPIDSKRK